jgi:hypothetical protein
MGEGKKITMFNLRKSDSLGKEYDWSLLIFAF